MAEQPNSTVGQIRRGGAPVTPTVKAIEWRRVEGADRVYLVAIMTDGSERKVTTPDGHVPAF